MSHARGESELWRIDAEGTNCRRFAETPGYRCGSPDWSPDGKWVAYDTWPIGKSGQNSQIAVIRADGTDQRLLGHGAMPSWSPDGKVIVCHTYEGHGGIYVMNVDGSGREKLIDHWGSPRWMPRGNRIASILGSKIAIYELETGKEWTFFRRSYPLRQGFGVSPDGLRFCFIVYGTGVGLATLNEKTKQSTERWLVTGKECYHASWAPDGRRVVMALADSENGGDQLYTMDVDKDKTPTFLPGQDREKTNTNPDWSPDGKTIIYCRQ